jgi:aminoglycoside phosphotransferase (APT) family kinase protein
MTAKARWEPEIVVDDRLARNLVETQFPQFTGAPMRRFGSGWDNAAYLVDDRIVFRFPQRSIAAPLMKKELAVLPLLAPRLPISIPAPLYAGVPTTAYPWCFGGYERLPGSTACSRVPSEMERAALAHDLGRFLRALHDVDPAPLREAGLSGDGIGKLDPARLGIDEAPLEGACRVVHGDLYARHLLLDASRRLCGVIDWGDVHYGLPAVDLSIVHMMIPAADHAAFFAVYGPVAPRDWFFARARARHHAGFAGDYADATGDRALRAACDLVLAYTA